MTTTENAFAKIPLLMGELFERVNSLSSSPTIRGALLARAQFDLTTEIIRHSLESVATNENLPQSDVEWVTQQLQSALLNEETRRRQMEALYLVGGQKQ